MSEVGSDQSLNRRSYSRYELSSQGEIRMGFNVCSEQLGVFNMGFCHWGEEEGMWRRKEKSVSIYLVLGC